MTWERRPSGLRRTCTQTATFARQPSDECATQSRHEETRMKRDARAVHALPTHAPAARVIALRPSDECGDAVVDMRRRG